jgi:hypothetical protein
MAAGSAKAMYLEAATTGMEIEKVTRWCREQGLLKQPPTVQQQDRGAEPSRSKRLRL